MGRQLLTGILGLLALGTGRGADAETVTIYRDTWGVPHVYAESEAGAAYGIGYAQAEDRLDDLFVNVRTGVGRMAEAFGPDHVLLDYAMQLVRNEAFCEALYEELEPKYKAMADAFVAGVQAFMDENPDRIPEHALELKPWHPMTLGRAMALRWPLGQIFDELGDAAPELGDPSSNSFVVGPERSAHGGAILLTDIHLGWESLALFYEARVRGGDLAMNGFFITGSPLMVLGHNENVGWAMTTGGPDTADVFELELRPGMPTQYKYDGEWKFATPRVIRIDVKGEDRPRYMPALSTELGPVVGEPDTERNVAYVGNSPLLVCEQMFQQIYEMNVAADADEFWEALAMNQLMEQNVTYADTKGTIGYVRVGRTPIRPEGDFDWSKPVPGNTSATQWTGIHPLTDHVAIRNPEQGYMQNCNVAPTNMMLDSPMTPDRYIDYLYNVSWDRMGTRGQRVLDLLSVDDSVTKEEAKAYATDVFDIRGPAWKAALAAAMDAFGGDYPDLADPAALIAGWDNQYEQTSEGATLMRLWRDRSRNKVDGAAILAETALSEADQRTLLDILQAVVGDMQRDFDSFRMPYGDVFRVGRGGIAYPIDGADYGGGVNGTRTVRDVGMDPDPDDPTRYIADGGSIIPMLMFFSEDGIESYTAFPWGQSNDPESDHYMDQGRELYSKRKFKPTWFERDALEANLASEKVLAYP